MMDIASSYELEEERLSNKHLLDFKKFSLGNEDINEYFRDDMQKFAQIYNSFTIYFFFSLYRDIGSAFLDMNSFQEIENIEEGYEKLLNKFDDAYRNFLEQPDELYKIGV